MAHEPLSETFSVENGQLVRHVVPATGGEPYRHTCDLATFEAVAHAIDELGDETFGLEDLARATERPHSQVNTAFAFLKERSIVVASGRRHKAGTAAVHLDAMTEYHALREGDRDGEGA